MSDDDDGYEGFASVAYALLSAIALVVLVAAVWVMV